MSLGKLFTGVISSVVMFAALGTVAALWENPVFIRMTPVGAWEVPMLMLLSVLSGVYVAIRRPFCTNGKMGTAAVLGYVGVACPICNKILLLVFGSELLLTYFEPMRIYVAVFGVAIAGWAVMREWRFSKQVSVV